MEINVTNKKITSLFLPSIHFLVINSRVIAIKVTKTYILESFLDPREIVKDSNTPITDKYIIFVREFLWKIKDNRKAHKVHIPVIVQELGFVEAMLKIPIGINTKPQDKIRALLTIKGAT
jgi:hypothetical protein